MLRTSQNQHSWKSWNCSNFNQWSHDHKSWTVGAPRWTSTSILARRFTWLEYYQTTVNSFGVFLQHLWSNWKMFFIDDTLETIHKLHLFKEGQKILNKETLPISPSVHIILSNPCMFAKKWALVKYYPEEKACTKMFKLLFPHLKQNEALLNKWITDCVPEEKHIK